MLNEKELNFYVKDLNCKLCLFATARFDIKSNWH